MGAKLQQSQIQSGVDTKTGGDSHRIVMPVEPQAGHKCSRHDQQAHLEEPGGALQQDNPLEGPARPVWAVGPKQGKSYGACDAAQIQSTLRNNRKNGYGRMKYEKFRKLRPEPTDRGTSPHQ